jgi:hypothetical protein
MKLNNKLSLIIVSLICLLISLGEISSLSLRKAEIESLVGLERHKASHKAGHKKAAANVNANANANTNLNANSNANANANAQVSQAPALPPAPKLVTSPIPMPIFNATNATLSGSLYQDLNKTYVVQNVATFKIQNRRWNDNKLHDKQLEDIYQDLIYKQSGSMTPEGSRAAIQLFVSQFESCDSNKDNVLSLNEFQGCMVNDTYLNQIVPPQQAFATNTNYSFTNQTGFYPILYNVLDTYRLNYTNFHDYMLLRLFVFSWRKCSVLGPFIEEIGFECAIEIAAGWKTLSKSASRHLYNLALELSNTVTVRNIDFISYVIVAQSARIFGKINGKEDHDATKAEFNMALDGNVLPSRYNQEVINNMFELIEDAGVPNQGMDIISFVFYDFHLRLFEVSNAQRRWHLVNSEFMNIFNNYLYPWTTLEEVNSIPQNNLTALSYQMYTYLNISNYYQEGDYFLKFPQLSETKKAAVQTGGQLGRGLQTVGEYKNMTFNLNQTSQWLFNILDNDSDGFLSFYDYGNFIQIAYLFNKFDTYRKGRIVAGNLHEKYTTYADLPAVSALLRARARRFDLFAQDLYIDLMRAVLILRIDDIIKANIRRVDPTALYEVELKNIFAIVNLRFVPDAFLNKCLRGVDENNVPKYDWECAFINAVTTTSQYLEHSQSYLTVKSQNLTLVNTKFVNVDPQIQ